MVEFIEACNMFLEHNVTPTEGYLMFCISRGLPVAEIYQNYDSIHYRNLKVLGYMTSDGQITPKGLKIMSKEVETAVSIAGVPTLVAKIRELYPSVKLKGGYASRSSPLDVQKKLEQFFREYASMNYSHSEVLEATKRYAEECESNSYEYMMMLKYFIKKLDKGSMLADIIDAMRRGDYNSDEQEYKGVRVE